MPTTGEFTSGENTYVIDPESAAEMARLSRIDDLTTECMGGLFANYPDLSNAQRVLDVACGPGAWACELAYKYPEMEVVGVDISHLMIEYARAQAKVQRLGNVRFVGMDATKPLEFPDNYFDIVNARFMCGFMSQETWPTTVKEFVRITRPGGWVRLTETDTFGVSTSYALEKYNRLFSRALFLTGRSFVPYRDGQGFGVTPKLEVFLRDASCQDFHSQAHVLDYSYGTRAQAGMFGSMKVSMKLLEPFLVKVGVATQEELDKLFDRLSVETMSEDFRALWYFLSVQGRKPE